MKELLKNLIQADSTLASGELNAANALADFFKVQNIDHTFDKWDDNRANITATIPSTDEKPALLFASHLDVVPPGDDKWTYPPFDATEVDGKIYGRGSTDMKGGIAAASAAAAEIVNSGIKLKGDLVLTATAGEETDSVGIKRFAKQYASKLTNLAGIIIPEPTNFDIISAHRGILWLEVTTKGKTAHGSMPHLGINAITQMTELINRLPEFNISDKTHHRLGKCSISPNQITGGNAANVIPDRCSLVLDIRTLPGQSHDDIIQALQDFFPQIKSTCPDFNAEIKTLRSVEAMETDTNSAFVKTFCKTTQIEKTKAVGYTTDAPFLKNFNAPTLIFGPGKSESCHKPNENIEIADIEKAKKYFKEIIIEFLT